MSSSTTLAVEWVSTAVAKATTTKGSGSFVEEALSGREACLLLSGALDDESRAAEAARELGLRPAVRVCSRRSVFAQGSSVAVVWDAAVSVADASTAVTTTGGLVGWAGAGESGALPFQICTVLALEDEPIPKALLEILQGNKCFVPVADFDEYVTAAALIHSPGGARAPWMDRLAREAQNDWMVAFQTNHPDDKPAWLKKSRADATGKGKEEEEETENEDGDLGDKEEDIAFARSVGQVSLKKKQFFCRFVNFKVVACGRSTRARRRERAAAAAI